MIVMLPEELHVAAMRLDVIDFGSQCRPALALALGTERMTRQKRASVFPPSVVVAALAGIAAPCIQHLLALLLILDD